MMSYGSLSPQMFYGLLARHFIDSMAHDIVSLSLDSRKAVRRTALRHEAAALTGIVKR